MEKGDLFIPYCIPELASGIRRIEPTNGTICNMITDNLTRVKASAGNYLTNLHGSICPFFTSASFNASQIVCNHTTDGSICRLYSPDATGKFRYAVWDE